MTSRFIQHVMSSLLHHSTVPHTAPIRSSLRHIDVPDNYRQWKFTSDTRPLHEQNNQVIGVANGNKKFGSGFFRRHINTIEPYSERESNDTMKQQRSQHILQLRKKHIANIINCNGDIVQHTHITPHNDVLTTGRKHHAQHNQLSDFDSTKQNRLGSNRYFYNRIAQRSDKPHTTASLIGYGRSDIASSGAADAFIPYHTNTNIHKHNSHKPAHLQSQVFQSNVIIKNATQQHTIEPRHRQHLSSYSYETTSRNVFPVQFGSAPVIHQQSNYKVHSLADW